jgi:AcrR family transcriptional regulator
MSPRSSAPPGDQARRDWTWKRTTGTRRTLLDAARDVFVESGYSSSNIADIVERSGLSVGSIYHHFGGKAELFVALFDDFDRRSTAAAYEAVDQRRQAGLDDVVELFTAGARAYLEYTQAHLAEARLFSTMSDVPPGFDALMSRDSREWHRRNRALLHGDADSLDARMSTAVLTAIVDAGIYELISADAEENPLDPERIIEATIEYIRKAGA